MRKYRLCSDGIFRVIGKKEISVNVRFSKKIYDIVNNYEGKNFSDKLDNLIFDYNEFRLLIESRDYPKVCVNLQTDVR